MEVLVAFCAYGSVHPKEGAFLTVVMSARSLAKKCSRDHSHLRIEGKFTKPSATYCQGLAVVLARVFAAHVSAVQESLPSYVSFPGLEDQLSNEVLFSSEWKVIASWTWKGQSHINILEMATALRAYEQEALRGGDLHP